MRVPFESVGANFRRPSRGRAASLADIVQAIGPGAEKELASAGGGYLGRADRGLAPAAGTRGGEKVGENPGAGRLKCLHSL